MIPVATPPSLQASIHIGASSISILIMEKQSDGSFVSSEYLEQSIPLAREIFQKGSVSRSTIERCVNVLRGYLEALRDLGGTEDTPIRAVSTNILNEATNLDIFTNRIQIGCGLEIETLDEGEMTRLIYLKTRRRLRDTPSMKKRTTLVVHVGPGNTRALLFKKGRISGYSSYRLGVYRTHEFIDSLQAERVNTSNRSQLIREHIRNQVSQIHQDYGLENIEELVMIGYEIQHLSYELDKMENTLLSINELSKISDELSSMSEENRVRKYQLDYNTAQAIVPAVEINLAIAEILEVKDLRLPGSNYERGLLLDLPTSSNLTEGFQLEVLRSAEAFGKKYRTHSSHSSHSNHVAFLAEKLFLATRELHGLGDHDSLLLKCAAILHECGHFISPRAHHKHSFYIISNSEIFGLGQYDITLVALIARYHRRSGPKPNHTEYKNLSAEDRMRVGKLAALLRVVDALDKSHASRIHDFRAEIKKSKLTLHLSGIADASLERIAMRSKANLFKDIFGLQVSLREDI